MSRSIQDAADAAVSREWNLSPNTVQQNLVANLVCIAGGALISIILSNYLGRLPVLFVFHTIGLGTGIWNAAAQTLPSYIASRAINGVFSIVAAGVSISRRSSMATSLRRILSGLTSWVCYRAA